jgi:hypothetical protein
MTPKLEPRIAARLLASCTSDLLWVGGLVSSQRARAQLRCKSSRPSSGPYPIGRLAALSTRHFCRLTCSGVHETVIIHGLSLVVDAIIVRSQSLPHLQISTCLLTCGTAPSACPSACSRHRQLGTTSSIHASSWPQCPLSSTSPLQGLGLWFSSALAPFHPSISKELVCAISNSSSAMIDVTTVPLKC